MRDPARFRILACGRRWGKSTLALHLSVETAFEGDRQVWFVAPTFRMVDLHWRTLKRHIPHIFPAEILAAERRIVLANGSEIAFRSADNPDHLRGVGLDLVVVDEAAFVPDGETVWTEALRPTLSDRLGKALIISTPRGRNWFHSLFLRGLDPDDPDYSSHRFPTAGNPLIAASEIESAERELPRAIFAQEYLAEFLDDGGSVFRKVNQAAVAGAVAPYPGTFVVGVDWAKRQDFTVFVVLDVHTGRAVEIERFSQIDYALQTQRLKALCGRWSPVAVQAEQNSMGEPIIEQLQRDGLPVVGFKTTSSSKPRIIEALAVAFEQQEITIPDDPALIAELEAYTLEPTRAGNYRYNAPPGLHDDTVMALAIAWDARGKRVVDSLAAYVS